MREESPFKKFMRSVEESSSISPTRGRSSSVPSSDPPPFKKNVSVAEAFKLKLNNIKSKIEDSDSENSDSDIKNVFEKLKEKAGEWKGKIAFGKEKNANSWWSKLISDSDEEQKEEDEEVEGEPSLTFTEQKQEIKTNDEEIKNKLNQLENSFIPMQSQKINLNDYLSVPFSAVSFVVFFYMITLSFMTWFSMFISIILSTISWLLLNFLVELLKDPIKIKGSLKTKLVDEGRRSPSAKEVELDRSLSGTTNAMPYRSPKISPNKLFEDDSSEVDSNETDISKKMKNAWDSMSDNLLPQVQSRKSSLKTSASPSLSKHLAIRKAQREVSDIDPLQ
jgi:hypothetical protein